MKKIRLNFLKVSVLGGLALVPLLIWMFFAIPAATVIVFGEKWLGIIPIVKILILYLVWDSISLADYPVMMASGRVQKVNTMKLWVTAVLVVVGYGFTSRFGVLGMAWAYTVLSILDGSLVKKYAMDVMGMTWSTYFKSFQRIAWILIAMVSAMGCADLFLGYAQFDDVNALAVQTLLLMALFGFFMARSRMISWSEKKVRWERLIHAG